MNIFNTLTATVSGSNVLLAWTNNDPGFPPVTAFAIQRSPFGQSAWTTIVSGLAVNATNTYTDTPGQGDWSYQIAATVTKGGVDSTGTLIYSNQVNASTEPTTGAVTLSLGSLAESDPINYTRIVLGWSIAGVTATDVEFYSIQRSLNGGTMREIKRVNEFAGTAYQESIPNGSGTITYQIVANLVPNFNSQLATPALSTSNQASITI